MLKDYIRSVGCTVSLYGSVLSYYMLFGLTNITAHPIPWVIGWSVLSLTNSINFIVSLTSLLKYHVAEIIS